MTVKELIKALKSIKNQDAQVVVQYRDDGGEYYGFDEDVYVTVDDTNEGRVIL